ncbi:MAG TPA: permease-like cell division protein FtsX [Patescibacteria group bacterium]
MKTHFKTSIDSIKRSPFQALASISVLAVTFFVATIIIVLVYSSSKVLSYFETRPQVIVFLKSDATVDQTNALKAKLSSDIRLKDVKYVSKEDALSIYKNATSDNPLLGELVSPSIFPASLEFSVSDLGNTKSVIEEVKKEAIVDSIGFTASIGGQNALDEVVDKLRKVTLYVRGGGLALVAVLGFASFLVLMVVIGMRITTRRSDLETLKLIGATPGFIRAPILMEAITYAVVGATIGWIIALILILYATPSILSYFVGIAVLPRDTVQFFELMLLVLGGEILVSMGIAIMGAYVATARALKSQ